MRKMEMFSIKDNYYGVSEFEGVYVMRNKLCFSVVLFFGTYYFLSNNCSYASDSYDVRVGLSMTDGRSDIYERSYRGVPFRRRMPLIVEQYVPSYMQSLTQVGVSKAQAYGGKRMAKRGLVDSLLYECGTTALYEMSGEEVALYGLAGAARVAEDVLYGREPDLKVAPSYYAERVIRDPGLRGRIHETFDHTINTQHPKARRAMSVPGIRKVAHKIFDHELKKVAKKHVRKK
jgi:hypothetical protein